MRRTNVPRPWRSTSREEKEDGVWVVRVHERLRGAGTAPNLEESEGALLSCDLNRAVDDAAVRQRAIGKGLLLLQPRLDHVKWEARKARSDTRDGARGEEGRDAVNASECRRKRLLRLVRRREHANVHRHGTQHRGRRPSPERQDALFSHDPRHRIKDAAVAPLGFGRQRAVSLHAHKNQVGRVSDKRRDGASGERSTDLEADGKRVRRKVPSLQRVRKHPKEAEARAAVQNLPRQRGPKTRIKHSDALRSEDTPRDLEGRWPEARTCPLPRELELRFQEIDRLRHAGRDGSCDHAGDEGLDSRNGDFPGVGHPILTLSDL